ncbi:MAG TPA: 1,2-phenylacetyl-CoA epoxidase subunit PaaD [Candidatus Dormibacteraeota bacterium]
MVNAAAIHGLLAEVADPEIPVLTIADLGILREVRVDDGGGVEVDITPTYSGCPALEAIRADIEATLRRHGHTAITVRTVLTPAWTTDWMSADGRRKLHEYGIAPPGPTRGNGREGAEAAVLCPQCGSAHTSELSRFGSTPCKALHRCVTCREPFEHFKAH